jgi:hypothetical protein
MHTEKGSRSNTIEHEAEQRSYAEIVRSYHNKEGGKKIQEEYERETAPPRRFII